jgi:hypothetical protein
MSSILKLWCSAKLAILRRSFAVPQSLVLRVIGSVQKCCQLSSSGSQSSTDPRSAYRSSF